MKKNLPLLLTLLALILSAIAETGCSSKAKRVYHMQRANKFLAANDFERAEIEYLNVLHSDPLNAEAIGKLGNIYYDEGRLQRAGPFLTKGSELATNDLNLRLKLGFIYSAVGRTSEARDEAVFILDRQPQNDQAPLLLAEASLTPKEMAVARQRLQTLAQHGDRAAIEAALGNMALHEQNFLTAETAFKRAQALDDKSAIVYSGLAKLSLMKNDLAQAAVDFKQSAELSPPRSPRQMEYARFEMQSGDPMAAKEILDALLKKAPDYVPALMGLAQIAAAQTNFMESTSQLAKVMVRDPDNFDALMLDSQLKLAQNQTVDAVTGLERLTRLFPRVPQAHYELALAYYQLALADHGKNENIKDVDNENIKAINSLGLALELDANYTEAILLMAKAQVNNMNPNPAIVTLERLLQKQPQLVQAQLLLADAYREAGRPDQAMTIYLPLEKEYPKNPELPLLIGSALLQQSNYIQARQEFERLLTLQPNNLMALEELVDLDLMDKNYLAAQQRVQVELDRRPKVAELRLLLAKVFLTAGNSSQAEATLLQTIQVSPDAEGAYLMLAQFYFDTKQNQKALAQLDVLSAKNPKNLPALMLAANIQSGNNDYKRAAAIYEQALQSADKNLRAAIMNNLAYLYSEKLGQLDRAYDLAKQSRDLLPYDPSTADTLGWICYQRGAYPTALALLQESIAKLPNVPEIQFHLGMANYMLGNEDAARVALLRATQSGVTFFGQEEAQRGLSILAINPQTADSAGRTSLEKRVAEKSDDQIALSRLAAIYLRDNELDKAGSAYEKVLQANPQNLPAMINLIQIYSRKDVNKAYQMAKAAYQSAPNNPEISHLFGRLAYQTGDYKLAATLLQQTVQNQPDNGLGLFDFAQAAYSVGRVTDAQTALQSALQFYLPVTQAQEAKRMLDMINLAASPPQAVAASAQVAEILKAEPNYVPALMAQAAANENQANLAAAETTYEKILNRYQDFSPVQRELAILYSRDSAKTNQAYALAIKAREIFPSDPALTKALGLIVLQEGDAMRAVQLFNDAAALASDDAEIYFYLGTAQFQLKHRTEAKTALQQALVLKLSAPQANAARLMLEKLK